MDRTIPGTMPEVAGLCSELRLMISSRFASRDFAGLTFALEIVAREALQNALDYGCGGDPSKTIRLSIRESEGILRMEIADEGPGFDPLVALDQELESSLSPSGNGLRIIANYSDRYEYRGGGRILLADFFLKGVK